MYLYLCPPSCSCNQILRLTRKIFFLCYGIIVSTQTCNLPYCCYTTLLFPSVKGSSFQADFLEALVTIQNSSSCSLLQLHYCGRPRVAPNHIIARQCYCLYVLGFPYVAENNIVICRDASKYGIFCRKLLKYALWAKKMAASVMRADSTLCPTLYCCNTVSVGHLCAGLAIDAAKKTKKTCFLVLKRRKRPFLVLKRWLICFLVPKKERQ